MSRIVGSLGFGLLQMFHPRILWLMVWPVLIAVAIWGVVVFVFWTQAALWLGEVLQQWIQRATFFLSWDAGALAVIMAKVLIVIMVVPLVQLTALLILGVFGLPEMVKHVAAVRFPALARRQGGNFAGSVWNSVVALLGMVLLFLVTLPLWLVPLFWPVLAPAILGWVNQRVLRYDAIAEHASAEEMAEIFAVDKGNLYLMGFLLAMASYIPIAGWFAPVLFGIAYIHYLLGELERRRGAPIEGQVISAEGVQVLPPGQVP
jgi:CysZ protein